MEKKNQLGLFGRVYLFIGLYGYRLHYNFTDFSFPAQRYHKCLFPVQAQYSQLAE